MTFWEFQTVELQRVSDAIKPNQCSHFDELKCLLFAFVFMFCFHVGCYHWKCDLFADKIKWKCYGELTDERWVKMMIQTFGCVVSCLSLLLMDSVRFGREPVALGLGTRPTPCIDLIRPQGDCRVIAGEVRKQWFRLLKSYSLLSGVHRDGIGLRLWIRIVIWLIIHLVNIIPKNVLNHQRHRNLQRLLKMHH